MARSIKGIKENLASMKRADNAWADRYVRDVGWLLNELDRVRNEATQQAAQWQPIETAPRDGTAILVGRERNSPQSVRWMISVDKQASDGWWFVGGYDGHRLRWEPTHWMPLPPIAAIGDDKDECAN